MAIAVTSTKPTASGPTVRQMLSLWLPLAASTVMMVLEPSTINVGLGRTHDPELALAAFGVAFSLALLVEAPIIMLIDASVARSTDRVTFALVRRFSLLLGLAVTAIGLFVSLTPIYDFVVLDLMNIPADVAAIARPTFQILSFWPLPIGWRRAHQGVLIRAHRTNVITVATGVRLLVLALGMFGGLLLLPDQGAVEAGLAMVLSVIVEAALITWATNRTCRSDVMQPCETTSGDPPMTMRELWRFYWPLAMTTIFQQATRPLLNAGIAFAALARPSLAVWPVTWGFVILIAGPAWSLQQLTTALAADRDAYRRVQRFALSISSFFALLLSVVAFTPLHDVVMGGVYNLSPDLCVLARPATQFLAVYPLVLGCLSLLRGGLIKSGNTGAVRSAMTVNVSVLAVTLLLGVTLFSPPGAALAAVATMAGALGELAWLFRKARG